MELGKRWRARGVMGGGGGESAIHQTLIQGPFLNNREMKSHKTGLFSNNVG